MGIRLEGKPVVAALRSNINERVAKLGEKGIKPTIQIIRVGEREDDISYEKSILKNCEMLNIKSIVKTLPVDVSMDELVSTMKDANNDKDIHGIMLFRPLPAHLNIEVIRNVIHPAKDIDCMSPVNLGKVFEGNPKCFAPCTPKAVVELLKFYNVPLFGADVAILGTSLVVGRPLAMLLMVEKSTVTLCHSKTKNVPDITKKSDIVVTAVGKAKRYTEEYFTENSVVVDVGINDAGDGKICGDVDYDQVVDKVKAITPVPGGVGLITTTLLLSHVVIACEDSCNA
jgi:methylenetetrahydrofolate dehydrogenase (NADP+) / methenyltetrahydrofolate cyclohydrolase